MADNIKLTAKSIDSIKVPDNKAEIICYDSEVPGFGCRVREAGSRNFVFSYRFAAVAEEDSGLFMQLSDLVGTHQAPVLEPHMRQRFGTRYWKRYQDMRHDHRWFKPRTLRDGAEIESRQSAAVVAMIRSSYCVLAHLD
jgi:hypothetical protein